MCERKCRRINKIGVDVKAGGKVGGEAGGEGRRRRRSKKKFNEINMIRRRRKRRITPIPVREMEESGAVLRTAPARKRRGRNWHDDTT
jgi:hypothetical protein